MNTQKVKFEINMNKRLNEIDERLMKFKEQVIESVEEQIKSKVTQIDNMKVSDSGSAVSYTHLDVYKRQVSLLNTPFSTILSSLLVDSFL